MEVRALTMACLLLSSVSSAGAMTLEGSVEEFSMLHQSAVIERPRREKRIAYEGHIGVRVSTLGDVEYVHPESPAARHGIQVGDQVLVVDGRKKDVWHIGGDPGTTVELEIRRKHRKEHLTEVVERVATSDILP